MRRYPVYSHSYAETTTITPTTITTPSTAETPTVAPTTTTPPLPPKLLRVPPPAKHFLGRGMEEQRENQRRQLVYEEQLAAYYRKYGGG